MVDEGWWDRAVNGVIAVVYFAAFVWFAANLLGLEGCQLKQAEQACSAMEADDD
jgi:hypothetical protein